MSDSNGTLRLQREVLPIPDQPYAGFVAYDAKDPDSKFAPIEELRPPQGAPNVLIVLLDDVGFGASSAFGGRVRCQPPNGLRQTDCATRAFTRPRCAPPRAPRSYPAVTIIRWEWVESRRLQRRRQAIIRAGRTRWRRSPRFSG